MSKELIVAIYGLFHEEIDDVSLEVMQDFVEDVLINVPGFYVITA